MTWGLGSAESQVTSKDFNQYMNLASSTGVVPFSKIHSHFPDLDSDMVINFLCHLEFCHNVADSEVLQLLHSLGDSEPVVKFDPAEKFLFFPNLVSIKVPSGVCHGRAVQTSSFTVAWSCSVILGCSSLLAFFKSSSFD